MKNSILLLCVCDQSELGIEGRIPQNQCVMSEWLYLYTLKNKIYF